MAPGSNGNEWLWVLDYGLHGLHAAQIVAIDIETGQEIHQYEFPRDIAPLGSMLNDFQVDSALQMIYIADCGYFKP